MGFEPIIGAFLFSICAALGIGYIKRKGGTRSDVIISLFWSLGMALGILFVALMSGYPLDLSSYLFGSILSVTKANLYLMICLTFIVIFAIVFLFNDWKAYLFDEEFALIIGIKTVFLEYLLLVLVAMSVVVLIRVVGIILVIALLTAPTATAGMLTSDLKKRMVYSVLLGNFFGNILSFNIYSPIQMCENQKEKNCYIKHVSLVIIGGILIVIKNTDYRESLKRSGLKKAKHCIAILEI